MALFPPIGVVFASGKVKPKRGEGTRMALFPPIGVVFASGKVKPKEGREPVWLPSPRSGLCSRQGK
jgi:hypothetical protein